MKKILKKYSLAATLMAILCLLPASCITDDAPAATEKATVTMTFTTRAVTDDTNGSSLLDNEQMRTLHVIMVRSSDSEVILNERYDIAPEVTSQTITYNDLVVDKNNGTEFDFYAIVNEGSLTLTEEVTEILNSKTTIDNVSLLENVILGENGFDFQNPPTDKKPLPQTVMRKNVHLEAEKSQNVALQLQFPVAKVCLKFINNTDKEQELTNIKMPNVKPNKGYLFVKENNLPTQISYTDLLLKESITIASSPKESEEIISYLYPGHIGTGYELVTNWEYVGPQSLKLQKNNETLTHLSAGECLNIIVTLNSTPKDTELQWTISGWTKEEIDVPFE